MPRPQNQDAEFLHAALVGFEYKLAEVEQRIGTLRSQLGEPPAVSVAAVVKRTMSAAARRRIALAQKKRWARYKAGRKTTATPKAPATKPVPAKSGKGAMVAATSKRPAPVRKKHQAAKPVAKKTAAKKTAAPKTQIAIPPEVKAPAETAPSETVAATPAAE